MYRVRWVEAPRGAMVGLYRTRQQAAERAYLLRRRNIRPTVEVADYPRAWRPASNI